MRYDTLRIPCEFEFPKPVRQQHMISFFKVICTLAGDYPAFSFEDADKKE